ncbi:MAG TPA: hypothetical protein VGC41_10930, partial [Kofleriaceae bacterium]
MRCRVDRSAMARELADQERDSDPAHRSLMDINVDAEHDPTRARKASNAALQRLGTGLLAAPAPQAAVATGAALHGDAMLAGSNSVDADAMLLAKECFTWAHELADKKHVPKSSEGAGMEPLVGPMQNKINDLE